MGFSSVGNSLSIMQEILLKVLVQVFGFTGKKVKQVATL
jgi:hypothetical protein